MSRRTLAILGGGQLGMMLAEAAAKLEIDARCFDTTSDACAKHACPLTVGNFEDADAVRRFCEGADAVTTEWESIPLSALEAAQSVAPLSPGVGSFAKARDRFAEKQLFDDAGVPTPECRVVRTAQDVDAARAAIPGRMICKSRHDGYDGHGQFRFGSEASPGEIVVALRGTEVLCQAFLPFDREISVVLARDASGGVEVFPVCENTHDQGILIRTIAPSVDVAPPAINAAIDYATNIVHQLGHVGVLAVEFFVVGDSVVANEIAPRVHNSGHWTLASRASQFEQHVRAVVGLPLLPVADDAHFGMVNIIGWSPSAADLASLASVPGIFPRMYGKSERAGRKLGHVAVRGDSPSHRDELCDRVSALVGSPVLGSG